MRRKQVLSARLDVGERLLHVGRHFPVHISEDHLVEAEDRVQRRAQLVTHAGEEVRLVLARFLELLALLRDLAEQARVLDRHRGLGGESLEELDDFRRERTRRLAAYRERADDVIVTQQRDRQHGAVAGLDEEFLARCFDSRGP
jgi:hypothetical protein